MYTTRQWFRRACSIFGRSYASSSPKSSNETTLFTNPLSTESGEKVKSYLVITSPNPDPKYARLDPTRYLNGEYDTDMQQVAHSMYAIKREGRISGISIYPNFELFERRCLSFQNPPHPSREGAYVLRLKTTVDETIKLAQKGRFHEACIDAVNFHDWVRSYQCQQANYVIKVVNPPSNATNTTLPTLHQ